MQASRPATGFIYDGWQDYLATMLRRRAPAKNRDRRDAFIAAYQQERRDPPIQGTYLDFPDRRRLHFAIPGGSSE